MNEPWLEYEQPNNDLSGQQIPKESQSSTSGVTREVSTTNSESPAPWESYQKEEEAAPDYSLLDRATQYASGFNEIIPNTLGLLGDAAAGIQNLRPSYENYMQPEDLPKQPTVEADYGSEFFRGIAKDINMIGGDETAFTRAGNYTSLGLSFLTGARALLGSKMSRNIKDVRSGKPVSLKRDVTRRIGEKMTAPLTESPGATIATEFAGSGGAVLGGEIAADTLGENWRMPFELIAGVPSAMAGNLGYRFAKVTAPTIRLDLEKTFPLAVEAGGLAGLAKKGYYGAKALANPKTRAAKRLAEVSESPSKALKALETDPERVLPGLKQTPASKTGDQHLMALEQEVINENPALYNLIKGESANNYDLIRQEIKSLYSDFPVELAQAELRKNTDAQIALLDTSLAKARDKVKVAIAALGPNADRPTINKMTSEIIEDAANTAKMHEKQLWSVIDEDLLVSNDALLSIKDSYTKHIASIMDVSDIPSVLKNQLGKMKGTELVGGDTSKLGKLGGLKNLRSSVMTAIRSEKSDQSPNWNKVRLLHNFQQDVLDQMRVTDKSPHLDTAIAFSGEMNRKFRQGAVGKIRGYDPTGGGRIEPELTLERTVGTRGPEAGVAARQLSDIQEVGGKQLLQEDPANLVQEYVKSRIKIASPDGKVREATALTFLDNNQDLIVRFPALGAQVKRAIQLEHSYKALETEVIAMKGGSDLRLTAKLLDKSPGDFARTILSTGSGAKETARVWKQLSPKARKAMTGDFLEFLQRHGRTPPDQNGHYGLDGNKMRAMYLQHEKSFNHVLDGGQKKRLNQIINSISESQFPKEGTPKVEGGMNDLLASIFRVPARILGAKIGAKAGGGKNAGVSLQAAQLGASRAQGIYENLNPDKAAKLLNDAVLDEKLYKSLLLEAERIKSSSKAFKLPRRPKYSVFQAWMIANGIQEFQEK